MKAARHHGEFKMLKTTLFAALAIAIAAPVFAQESEMRLDEGESVFVSPDGTLRKSNAKVSDADHETALANGTSEILRRALFYRRGGKLYGGSWSYLGGWEQGSPGTANCE
jgi:hypothetical protein